MRSFQTLDTFNVPNRGIVHVVAYPEDRLEADVISELIGADVMLDGVQRRVIGMMNWLVQSKVVEAGDAIAILVAAPPEL